MSWRAEALGRLDEAVRRRRMKRARRLLRHPFSTLYKSAAFRLVRALSSSGRRFVRSTRTVFGDRMRVIVPSADNDLWLNGAAVDSDAEARLARYFLLTLREGQVFFDVGACLGYYSLLAAGAVGPAGAVHAFEAASSVLPLLRDNVKGKPNAVVVEKAVSDKSGPADFFVAGAPFIGTSSLRGDWQERPTQKTSVQTTSLDDYCFAKKAFPDVIKLDVEGVEDLVIEGMDRLLREKAPVIAMEVFFPLIDADQRALAALERRGYGMFAIEESGELRALAAAGLDAYFRELKARYAVVQDSPNDFDNLILRRVT